MSAMKTRSFPSAVAFRAWLVREHSRCDGLLLRIYKKSSGIASVTYAEARDQALCFGWIDARKLPLDGLCWIQAFQPRRSRSKWSKKNTEHAERLIKSGEMTDAGHNEVRAAKADGRWRAAYDSPSTATMPSEFLERLARNKRASVMYATLNKANLYAIAYRLQTAKRAATRYKRMQAIIDMLARGEKFH
ncbi:MAG: YdeI/OmpD-associated family protein [Steroidobacteraceae bacterium]